MARKLASNRTVTIAQQPSLSELSFGQKQKLNYLSSVYDDERLVLNIVNNLEPRGRNNWETLNENIRRISNADTITMNYFNSIKNTFDPEREYSTDDIVRIIGGIRRRLDLPPFTVRLTRMCEADFFTVFMAHDVVDAKYIGEKGRVPVLGYKIAVCLIQE